MRLYFRPQLSDNSDACEMAASFTVYPTYVLDSQGVVVATQSHGQWWRVGSSGKSPYGPYTFLSIETA